jgi:hypothetical protein
MPYSANNTAISTSNLPKAIGTTRRRQVLSMETVNQGVFEVYGSPLPPTYDHHVDDLMNAEIGDLLPCTIAAGILSLYEVLGYPTTWYTPDPLSHDKFDDLHTHHREASGLQRRACCDTTFGVDCCCQVYLEGSRRTPWYFE